MCKSNPFLTGTLHRFTAVWHNYLSHKNDSVDIELAETIKPPGRVDSGTLFCLSGSEQRNREPITTCNEAILWEPIYLNLGFEDAVHTKPLDYRTFAQWDAMEALAKDLERDGFRVEELWDGIEEMKVSGGDWDARVHPGWEINATFIVTPTWNERYRYEDDDDSDTRSYGDASQEEWRNDYINEYLDEKTEDWCLPRWRSRVEQEIKEERSQDPSWIMIMLGFASMAFFIVAVIVYTA